MRESIVQQARRLALTLVASCVTTVSLCACGGGGGGGGPTTSPLTVPTAPRGLTLNVGDGALSAGWEVPANDGGSAVQSYELEIDPAVSATSVTVSGTRALVRNLNNGTSYTVRVRSRNSVGQSVASVATATPRAASTGAYVQVTVDNDDSRSGVFDPSLLRAANGDLWMSYSSVDYHLNASNQLVQDVGIRLARSTNGGSSFDFVATIATPAAGTVTDSDPARSACGANTCTGRWVYETSWLIDDSSEPNAARRFKLFAHKYFLRPGGTATTLYHLGAIVMWTASDLNGPWSSEASLLGWNLTPSELAPLRVVNSLHPELAPCITVAEGTASVRANAIDFAFTCIYGTGNPLPQKIVLLRSVDHANTFQYVATLLTPADASVLGANFYTAPALLATAGNAPVLLATPAFNGIYGGCVVFPMADDASGALFRVNAQAIGIAYTPAPPNHFGGACAYDRTLGARGVLQNDVVPATPATNTQFRVLATQLSLQP